MNEKLVSVVIITHNRSRLLQKAIESVLNQTYNNIELIIVDDYSTDNTQEIVSQLIQNNPNIKYIRLEKQSGANAARNRGIQEAQGYFITGLDDDDTMTNNRIIELVNKYNDTFAYVCSEVFYISKKSKSRKRFKYFNDIITLEDMLYQNCSGNQILTTKQMFLDAGLYDETLISAQDYDMWLKLLLLKPQAKLVKTPLMNVDRDDAVQRISSSKRKQKGYFNLYKKYKKYMNNDQKRFQLFKLYLGRGKKITLKHFFIFISRKQFIMYLYLVLKSKR